MELVSKPVTEQEDQCGFGIDESLDKESGGHRSRRQYLCTDVDYFTSSCVQPIALENATMTIGAEPVINQEEQENDNYQQEREKSMGFLRDGNTIVLQDDDDDFVDYFEVAEQIDLTSFKGNDTCFIPSIALEQSSQFPGTIPEHISVANIPQLIDRLKSSRYTQVRQHLSEIQQRGEILPISPEFIQQPYVYHGGCSIFTDSEGEERSAIEIMQESGVYGNPEGVCYFSTDPVAALGHGKGKYEKIMKKVIQPENVQILFLTINNTALGRYRNIFHDPESLLPSLAANEYGKNFIVHNGIPVSSISKMEVLRSNGRRKKIHW